MKVETQTHGGIAVLIPHGPLTAAEVEDFQRAVAAVYPGGAGKSGRAVIDMKDVPYLDSNGIETLLTLATAGRTYSAPRLARLSETCREALDLTDVLPRLDVFDTVENAIRSYKR